MAWEYSSLTLASRKLWCLQLFTCMQARFKCVRLVKNEIKHDWATYYFTLLSLPWKVQMKWRSASKHGKKKNNGEECKKIRQGNGSELSMKACFPSHHGIKWNLGCIYASGYLLGSELKNSSERPSFKSLATCILNLLQTRMERYLYVIALV